MSYHYSQPPPGYVLYDGYTTSSSTSPTPDNPTYDYYHPYQSPTGSPTATRVTPRRQHIRTTSHSSPQVGGWHSPAAYPSSNYQSMSYTTPPLPGYEKTPVYDSSADALPRSRTRRSSTATRPRTSSGSSSSPKSKGLKMPPEATAADAASHQIPAGYSLKNWDPTEKPILLLGSVFDANSLGKWVYDWTVYHHKAGSPLTEVAGELWLLLIKFSGKLKRADAAYARLRHRDDRELVHDFLASGERIWRKLTDLLKRCEEYMWRAARHDGARGKIQMGEKSGIEFVRTIFGRERELEMTEKLMQSIRLWSMRFDANCEDIVHRKDY